MKVAGRKAAMPPAARLKRGDTVLGVICGLAVIALFSGFTLVSRLGFSGSLQLLDVAALRFGIGGLLLAPVFIRYRLQGLAPLRAIALALLGGLGFALFAYTGFYLAPASHGAVLLHGTLPLLTFVIVQVLAPVRASAGREAGLALIAVGIAAMALDSASGASARQLAGDLALLLASLCWSLYAVLAQRWAVHPAHAASIVAAFSFALYVPLYLVLGDPGFARASWNEILLQAVFQGALLGAASIFIYTKAVSILGASQTALFTAAVPCITTLAAIPLLGEWPNAAAALGVLVVSVGLITAIRAAPPSPPPSRAHQSD
jgi:drug/metabolite transporter (DMT)-like permease